MGFFSDLKDDLSQAVNELLPEDAAPEAEEQAVQGTGAAMTEPDAVNADLDQMLEQFGSGASSYGVSAQEAPVDEKLSYEESAYTAPPVQEKSIDFSTQPAKRMNDEVSVLTDSMIINGNIATEGALDIRGSIVGNVEALGKLNVTGAIQGNSQAAEIFADGAKITGELRSQGSIKIGQSTVIIGNVFATSAVIAGAIKGDIDVKGPVVLDASAIVMGDIKSKSVQINNGAVIEGMCSQCYADVNPTSFFEELKKMK